MLRKSELIISKTACIQLDELIINTNKSLRNNKKQPNEDTIYGTINKDLTWVTIEKLKKQLTVLLGKEKIYINLTEEGILIFKYKRMTTCPIKHPFYQINCLKHLS